MRCRYWRERLQWPARSWCTLTASSLMSVRTGAGIRSPMMRRKRLSGQLRRQALEAERATARVSERTSTGVPSCGRLEAPFASSSARSFEARPQWAGTHCR